MSSRGHVPPPATGGKWRLMGEFHITAGELLRRLPASIAPLAFALLLLLPLPAHSDDVENGIAAAADIAANQPKPFVDTVCPLMQQQADAMGLPAMFFVRLIWKESRFNPGAVSPKGAQGIAQFMPGTASDRGLDDPFEPKSAIVHSASLLADLKSEFGNFGLAAAAYNAGAERVRAWLDGRSSLPAETSAMCPSSLDATQRSGSCPRQICRIR